MCIRDSFNAVVLCKGEATLKMPSDVNPKSLCKILSSSSVGNLDSFHLGGWGGLLAPLICGCKNYYLHVQKFISNYKFLNEIIKFSKFLA